MYVCMCVCVKQEFKHECISSTSVKPACISSGPSAKDVVIPGKLDIDICSYLFSFFLRFRFSLSPPPLRAGIVGCVWADPIEKKSLSLKPTTASERDKNKKFLVCVFCVQKSLSLSLSNFETSTPVAHALKYDRWWARRQIWERQKRQLLRPWKTTRYFMTPIKAPQTGQTYTTRTRSIGSWLTLIPKRWFFRWECSSS